MKKLFIITLILSSITGSMLAQPGYMGKKFTAGFSSNFFLSIRSKDPLSFGSYYIPGVKSTGGINISYVMPKNREIELEYSNFKDWNAEYFPEFLVFGNLEYIKQNSFGLSIKNFGRRSSAPLGKYLKLSLAYTNNYMSDNIDFVNAEKYWGFKAGLGIGAQRVLFDNIVIDYGINGFLNYVSQPNTYDSFSFSGNTAKSRIFSRELLYFHLGVSYLMF